MIFLHTPDLLTGGRQLTDRLITELNNNKKVLWFISGGSNITLEVDIMEKLPQDKLLNLTIMLMDERYGVWGHEDSNYQQLLENYFETGTARFIPTLTHDNLTMEETARHFEQAVSEQLAANDIVIGLFGMGADGHTAGILPHTPATEDVEGLVVSYHTDQYDRISLSFNGLRKIDVGYLYAFGEAKAAPLKQLQETDTALAEQPVQILKRLKDCTVYSDQIGGTTV